MLPLLCSGLSAALLISVALPAWAEAPVPATLTPLDVPGTQPMGAAAVDLAAMGYTETEFLIEGTANRYRGAMLGEQETAEVIDGGWPWRSRLLLRTPAPEAFNGTLVVEWTNVTAGQDIDFAFAEMHDFLLAQGYAIATVSAQKMGVDRLKTWNPERYGALSVDADNTDPDTGAPIDGCGPLDATVCDPLAWDIYAQSVAALKLTEAADAPMHGYAIDTVIALGQSQSASRISTYYNTIQPLTDSFDGFLMYDLARQLRDDLDVPAITVNSEVTADFFEPTTDSAHVRIWDMAGAAHSSVTGGAYVDAMVRRDASMMGPDGPIGFSDVLAAQDCTLPPRFSRILNGDVLNAALVGLEDWIEDGTAAPDSRQFQRDAAGKVSRDAQGLPLGGLQMPGFTAPSTRYALNGPGVFCLLSGWFEDLNPEEMTARYGSRSDWLDTVMGEAQALVEARYLLPDGAAGIVTRAEAVPFAD